MRRFFTLKNRISKSWGIMKGCFKRRFTIFHGPGAPPPTDKLYPGKKHRFWGSMTWNKNTGRY